MVTKQTTNPLVNSPEVAQILSEAIRNRQEKGEHVAKLVRQSNAAHEMVGSNHIITGAEPSRGDKLRAAQTIRVVNAEMGIAQADLEDAEVALRDARYLAKDEIIRQIDEQRRPMVSRLNALLISACVANDALAELDEQAYNVRGHGTAILHWPELRPETPMSDTRIAAWRRGAREHQLLD